MNQSLPIRIELGLPAAPFPAGAPAFSWSRYYAGPDMGPPNPQQCTAEEIVERLRRLAQMIEENIQEG